MLHFCDLIAQIDGLRGLGIEPGLPRNQIVAGQLRDVECMRFGLGQAGGAAYSQPIRQ